MMYEIINLTLLVVVQEIEQFLKDYSEHIVKQPLIF